MGIWISETFVNATERVRYGESPLYEVGQDSLGKLFRWLQKEYGRCVSRVYVGSIPVGWVFGKIVEYEDSRPRYDDYGKRLKPEKYEREVWVTVHTAEDDVVRTQHLMDLDTQEEIAHG